MPLTRCVYLSLVFGFGVVRFRTPSPCFCLKTCGKERTWAIVGPLALVGNRRVLDSVGLLPKLVIHLAHSAYQLRPLGLQSEMMMPVPSHLDLYVAGFPCKEL